MRISDWSSDVCSSDLVDRDQLAAGIGDLPFVTELISGGVTIAEIQDVMEQAEGQGRTGAPFLPLSEALRNIVATSAISHGVDVDKFNAMFFAGDRKSTRLNYSP